MLLLYLNEFGKIENLFLTVLIYTRYIKNPFKARRLCCRSAQNTHPAAGLLFLAILCLVELIK